MWGGRFEDETDPRAADFGRSIEVDRALAADDLQGSIAHVHGLARAGALTAEEGSLLVEGLQALAADLQAGAPPQGPPLSNAHPNPAAAPPPKTAALSRTAHT